MSSQLRISADTSQVKKSILDIGKSLKDLKGSKVSIFTSEDKKFLKEEFKKEIALIKTRLKENRDEISKMVAEQKKMVQGSKEELEQRKKILEAYKVQARLAKQLGSLQGSAKSGGGIDLAGGGFMGRIAAFARMIPGIAALATIGFAISKGTQASQQFQAGVGNRTRLLGLGVGDQNFGSAQELARVGLTEQEMIQRRVEATAILGRQGTSQQDEMRKASFERAFGLEGGTMTSISARLRGSFGGQGANEAQMKLQASILAAGIEDAIGPYLESATQLLSAINDTGTQQTAEMTALFAQLTKDGERTPELIARAFTTINDSVKGATGEQSAFLQTAFARAGIGGGTLGGTKFALQSGGIMGLDRASLEKRGYNKQLLDQMEKSGMFTGVSERSKAIMDLMRQSGGLRAGEKISDITDPIRMIGLSNLANSIFGTKGDQGFDALMMLEKVQNKQMSKKQFEERLKEMQEGKDPTVSRLDKINNTLAGQTEILSNINTTLMEGLGKETVQVSNQLKRIEAEGIVGVTNVQRAINQTGATKLVGDVGAGVGKAMNSGGIGSRIYDFFRGNKEKRELDKMMSDEAVIEHAKKMRDRGVGYRGMSDEEIEQKIREYSRTRNELTAKEIGKEVANAFRGIPIINQNRTTIHLPDGKVTDRIGK